MRFALFLLSALLLGVSADVYMHNPRGSNNRLAEPSAERQNADRLFDSQNNNRGGYNVGDRTNNAFNANTPTLSDPLAIYDASTGSGTNAANFQYPMLFFEGSHLNIEWTNQHGCGGNQQSDPHQQNCDIIIQYMCETTDGSSPNGRAAASVIPGAEVLRDGGNTGTPDEPTSDSDVASKETSNDSNRRGRHESEGYYWDCKTRTRNTGLFTADQILNGQSAKFTRQNPNGNRRGLECPEERDYYPYWSPSPWKDIVVLTDHPQKWCDANGKYTGPSQNNNNVGHCTPSGARTENSNNLVPITQYACNATGGTWSTFTHGLSAPLCQQVDWARVNHLGNGRAGQPLTYNWTLPMISDLTAGSAFVDSNGFASCAIRLRYNISTDDYDPFNTTSSSNNNPNAGVISPVTQNPTIDIGAGDYSGLKLAINTAQFGRTFQDRSHTFTIQKRPAAFAGKNIYNLNVRGKRGNIVETFPAVEYDFVPNRFHVSASKNDLVHIQWTGSNTHNNGDPAGDGQAGDAGEGRDGTDRHSIAQLRTFGENFPLALDKTPDNMWSRSNCYNYKGAALSTSTSNNANGVNSGASTDCALYLATSGQFQTVSSVTTSTTFNPLLDDAPASLIGGVVVAFSTRNAAQTIFDYMATRNNNFSNRSQKGSIVVDP